MNRDNRIILIVIIYLLLRITLSILPSVQPFYTITNTDQYAHEVTTDISSTQEEYSWQGYYQLGPGETVEIRKPVSLMIRWMEPFRESDMFYSSSNYIYSVTSEGYQHTTSIQPGLSTSISFELHNKTEEFEIEATEIQF